MGQETKKDQLYILIGIVHPERAQISIGPFELKFFNPTTKNEGIIKLRILLNQITVYIYSSSEWDIFDLRNFVKQHVSDQLAIIGYLKGYAYDVEIKQILNEEKGINYVYGVDIPCIEERNQKKPLNECFNQIRILSYSESGVYIRHCFNDLSMAMRQPDDTAFYCFRALESLRQYCRIHFNIEKENDQWKKLGDLSGTNKDDISFIRGKAFPSRHGDFVRITDEDRRSMFLKTWDVVDAFIEKIGSEN